MLVDICLLCSFCLQTPIVVKKLNVSEMLSFSIFPVIFHWMTHVHFSVGNTGHLVKMTFKSPISHCLCCPIHAKIRSGNTVGITTALCRNKIVNVLYPYITEIKVREKSRECHNHKPQPFPDTKRKRKAKANKRKSNKRTKSTEISSLFPKWGNRNAKRTENTRTKWHKVRYKTNRLVE